MTLLEQLQQQRQASVNASKLGPPARTTNQFFGVGPITDMATDEYDARQLRLQFDAWVEQTYPKMDDTGKVVGQFTTAELGRGMHRGYPADKVLLDMMSTIHGYFGFPKQNSMAVGLGGGHSGFTVAALHLLTAQDPQQHVFVDTPRPETEAGKAGGFFRQSWGAQLLEMQRHATNGDESRIHFSDGEGNIPTADELLKQNIKVFFGVGHETTGATTYTEKEVKNLLQWIDKDPNNHHAIIDATSLLGAMPWQPSIVKQLLQKCCMFMPFQKAIGGISGYFVVSLTQAAIQLIDKNQLEPSWAIPRQLKIAVPTDPKLPLSSKITTSLGPIYDPAQGKMLGGIVNTFSTLAFAETTFGLLRTQQRLGTVEVLNQRSIKNRDLVNEWVAKNPLFALGVEQPESRGAAVTLLKVTDADINDSSLHNKIIEKSKQLLAYQGLTHPNGDYEKGLDVARYVNAFPGSPGDYRAWVGGTRPEADVIALLDNINYAYHRAKIIVLEELLAEQGIKFPASDAAGALKRMDDPKRAYKVLISDLVGMCFDDNGQPDCCEVKTYIESKGGLFHQSSVSAVNNLQAGKLHFFYQPNLSTEAELLTETADAQYDAVIAAATFLPKASKFEFGGVRIGAGTGNMGSDSWGGGNGDKGTAPLMNTPSFNSRATAQMAFKALLKVRPDLPVAELHKRVVAGDFDTGKNLCEYPTRKLEGQRIAILGYGNIGREVAKLAKAFGMQVVIYARAQHKDWIISEGFEYAESVLDAAKGADVISPHTGLGVLDAKSNRFANACLINKQVLSALNSGAIVINYDRGEVIDIDALDQALASGQVCYAAIDADLFKDANTGALSGPMQPYLALLKKHSDKLELLPHAAADTEHVSRAAGAKQAVDQIYAVIQFRRVTNLKGDLPAGYNDAGPCTVSGVGKVCVNNLQAALEDADELKQLRQMSESMAAFWGALDAIVDQGRRDDMISRYATQIIQLSNRYQSRLAELGLQGPFQN